MASYQWPPSAGGAGTVTSVALTAPSWLTVTGSPITTNGTIAITGTSESQNLFLASPNGSSGAMTPRAIVAADLPSLSSIYIPVSAEGTVTELTSSVLTLTGWANATIGSPTITVKLASGSQSGYLSSTDWTTFNGKQASGSYITDLTGDVTASGPGSVAATVAKIQSTVVSGTTGTGNVVFSAAPTLTGLLSGGSASFSSTIGASNLSGTNTGDISLVAVGSSPSANGATLSGQALTLQPADGTHPGLVTSGAQTIGGAKTFSGAISATNLSGTNTGDQTITLTSDVTGAGVGSFATTIAAGVVSLAKMANLAANSIIGNNTGSSATPIALTSAQVNTFLNIVSSVYVDTGNGHGSTNTKVRRYTNARLNTGSDITYADSATLGASFTINTAGVYSMKMEDQLGGGQAVVGITVNGSALTTAVDSITYAQGRRAVAFAGANNSIPSATCTLILAVNDVIRPGDDGTNNDTTAASNFLITRVA